MKVFYLKTSKINYVDFTGQLQVILNMPDSVYGIREVKHDVNGRQQTAKITSDFEFFSSNP